MEFTVEKNKERLDKFLVGKLPEFSRMEIQRFIKKGAVRVNGDDVIKPGYALHVHDRIVVLEELLLSKQQPYVIKPDPNIPLDIIYEDDDIVVINKPAGLLVHPTLKQPDHTLAHALVARYPDMSTVGESSLRPGIVHRLDKDTSGLLIITKTQAAFEYMKQQFLSHAVKKTYLALVYGIPKDHDGIIDYDIRPSTKNRLKKVAMIRSNPRFEGKKSTRTALTRYHVREKLGDQFALLEVTPETGRTHQIRVHLSAIEHSVVGDRLYTASKDLIAKSMLLKRQFLHAYKLEFIAPNGNPLTLEAPLPEDLEEFYHHTKNLPA